MSVPITMPQPARLGRPAGEREVDQRGSDHPADRGDDRRGEPATLAQLAHVELAADLEPDDEEEERHQPVVDPVPQIERELGVAEPDRQLGRPELLVRGAPGELAQTSAATVAASRTTALAFWVAANARKGAAARDRSV